MKNPLHNLADTVKALTNKSDSISGFKKSSPTLNILLPRLWPEECNISWCLRNGDHIISQGETENLSSLKEHQTGVKIIIWSPAALTLLIEADMPTRSRAKINQALPFVLEEQLLHSPDFEHYVYQIRSGQPLAVAVTAKQKIEKWLSVFHESGLLPPSEMFSQISGLPSENNCWSITIINNELLVKTSDYTGFSCLTNDGQPPIQLINAINNTSPENKPEKIIYHNIGTDLDAGLWTDKLGVTFVIKSTDIWSTIKNRGQCLNLLQGEYKQKREFNPVVSRYVPAAALLFIWITVSLIVNIWEWQSLKSNFKNTNNQMRQVFLTSFPGSKTIVDPALQMQRKFESLSGGSGGYLNNDFLVILTKCAPALSALGAGSIENIRYNKNNLDISLGLPDFKSLETLKERLSAVGMQVEVVAANSRSEGIEGRLKITAN